MPSEDPTKGLCLGPHGSPRGGGRFLMGEVPLLSSNPLPRNPHLSANALCIRVQVGPVRAVGRGVARPLHLNLQEREFCIDNLLVRIQFIIDIILVDRPCATEG